MKLLKHLSCLPIFSIVAVLPLSAQIQRPTFTPVPAFSLTNEGLVISRPAIPAQPFTVAGPRGVIVGTQDGTFESWILPVKLISHITIEANIEGYAVPIPVNDHVANIEVRPDRTTITYSHPGFTLRQIMFSPADAESKNKDGVPQVSTLRPGSDAGGATSPSTGPIVLYQIDALHPVDFIFRFTPEMRWMWPKRNDGIPGPDWVAPNPPSTDGVPPVSTLIPGSSYYTLHMDYPDLAGAITIPGATPGIMAPYQERPQVHPLELHLHYDPKRDGDKFFPLLMAVGTTPQTATNEALGQALQSLNNSIASAYAAQAQHYKDLLANSTSIETPDKRLNEAFQWAVVSIEQLKTLEYPGPASPLGVNSPETALVAGYYQSADSARPGFGWFFGRDALYTLYAVNGFGDFALTRSELEFLIRRQRHDGKIMHEYSQTANDPTVDWPSFPYMYAAADATPLFLMAVRDYYRASGDLDFIKAHREAIEKAWAFETDPAHDTDHDGIYDNSQGTGWVESWPGHMPHQEIYLALLDEQASWAYADIEQAFDQQGPDPNGREALTMFASPKLARKRADKIRDTIESEYYDPQKGCYAFATNPASTPNSPVDHTRTVYPAIAWWDYNESANPESLKGTGFSPYEKPAKSKGALAPEGNASEATQPLAHPEACLSEWAGPTLDTDWGLRDVASDEPYYDGMSYHQGSVWPLFTGWAALAEYRANQPLAGEQLLMQNVDLTWAQDPGAVTELLSGDYFIPFGRSTSHQLWSSAMVITPTLRGLFGISLDAATNTITVNPHLPALGNRNRMSPANYWDHAVVRNIHFGSRTVTLSFNRYQGPFMQPYDGALMVTARNDGPPINLRSDNTAYRQTNPGTGGSAQIVIPLPDLELSLPFEHSLPTPGSRPSKLKLLSSTYGPHQLTVTMQGMPETSIKLALTRNQKIHPKLQLISAGSPEQPIASLSKESEIISADQHEAFDPMAIDLHFPKGQGWQTIEFTLTW